MHKWLFMTQKESQLKHKSSYAATFIILSSIQLTGNHIFFLNRKKHHFLILIWKSANKVMLQCFPSGVWFIYFPQFVFVKASLTEHPHEPEQMDQANEQIQKRKGCVSIRLLFWVAWSWPDCIWGFHSSLDAPIANWGDAMCAVQGKVVYTCMEMQASACKCLLRITLWFFPNFCSMTMASGIPWYENHSQTRRWENVSEMLSLSCEV